MQCCEEANVVCSCDHARNAACEYCHPYLRTSFKTATPAGETYEENCLQQQSLPCNSCCNPCHQECVGTDYHYGQPTDFQQKESEQDSEHLHCASHSCPLGKIICCTDCNQRDCVGDRDIIKATDISGTQDGIICYPTGHQDPMTDETSRARERLCCAKSASWTEPRICRCDQSYPAETSERCECECGAAILKEPLPENQNKKRVRFADEVVTYEDCDRAFRNLSADDVKGLCSCCKECAIKGKDQCVGKPVLVYELPEPKLDDTSVTQKDFCWQKIPRREVPPWHPNIKDRWRHMYVPSLSETTYQSDFKPPVVVRADRKPVYLAPQREKIDPCQQLSEEYSTWKKTSTGEKHVYHSSCDACDKDLHRVHLHECDAAHLPPQYQCHGDGHICEPSYHTTGEKFTLCETGDDGNSGYWWKRTCCVPEARDSEKVTDLPPDLMKPVCPPYTTSYRHDFKDPKRLQNERLYLGNCSACEYCTRAPYEDQPNLLCTKDTRQPFITQKAGII